MSELNKPDLSWPPPGFKELEKISNLAGQAMSKDPFTAKVIGASYFIDVSPVVRNNVRYTIYSFQIDGWEYSINNESLEFPVLSFLLTTGQGRKSVHNIKSLACPIHRTPQSKQRAFIAGVSMIQTIHDGSVPDVNQLLKLHKIHPSQKDLYEKGRHRGGGLLGLLPSLFDKDKKETQNF